MKTLKICYFKHSVCRLNQQSSFDSLVILRLDLEGSISQNVRDLLRVFLYIYLEHEMLLLEI